MSNKSDDIKTNEIVDSHIITKHQSDNAPKTSDASGGLPMTQPPSTSPAPFHFPDNENLRKQAWMIICHETAKLMIHHKVIDIEPAPLGDIAGITIGWMFETQELLAKIQTLITEAESHQTDELQALHEAQTTVRAYVKKMRPLAVFIHLPSVMTGILPPIGEMGSYFSTAARLLEELSQIAGSAGWGE